MKQQTDDEIIDVGEDQVESPRYPKISEIFDAIENSRYIPGTIGGVILDRSGVTGGTHTRLYESLRQGGVVIVDKELNKEYSKVMELYYGKGKKDRVGYIYVKD